MSAVAVLTVVSGVPRPESGVPRPTGSDRSVVMVKERCVVMEEAVDMADASSASGGAGGRRSFTPSDEAMMNEFRSG